MKFQDQSISTKKMNWLKRLSPTRREPPCLEWTVLRHLPKVLVYGTSAFIVCLIKGPAIVADAYYLDDSDLPK